MGSPKELAGTRVMAGGAAKQGRGTPKSTPSDRVERLPGAFFPKN